MKSELREVTSNEVPSRDKELEEFRQTVVELRDIFQNSIPIAE